MKKPLYVLAWILAVLAYLAPAAYAAAPQSALAAANVQVWVAVAGFLSPLVAYVLNHFAPWVDEKAKGIALLVVAAAAGAITQAINAGHVGFNQETFQLVVTAIFTALVGHHGFFKAATIAPAFGAGSNHNK